jgi:hypothetical protein
MAAVGRSRSLAERRRGPGWVRGFSLLGDARPFGHWRAVASFPWGAAGVVRPHVSDPQPGFASRVVNAAAICVAKWLTRQQRVIYRQFRMGRAGIEPATLGLKVPCSTN